MRRRLLLTSVALLGFCAWWRAMPAAEPVNPRFTGTPFVRTWVADDYGGAPGNRAVVQHPRSGFIYVGNGSGVLEFDGMRWRLFSVPGSPVTSLTIDGLGRVWFVTDNDLGCLEPDARGDLHPISARPRLPREEPPIFPLGACLASGDGVFVVNRDRVFCFPNDGRPPRIWRFKEGLFPQLWIMDGAMHVRAGAGVVRLVAGEFQPVPGLRTFSFVTREHPAGGWQMVSRDGVRRWEGGLYRPVAPPQPAPIVSPLGGDFALSATFLADGRILFGTTRSGLVIADRDGARQQVIDRTRGLPSNRIEALCVDREGGVWLALRNGIARVPLDSPYARHGTTQQLIDSTPQALALHGGQLYVGGGEGLMRRDSLGVFHPVEDLPYLVRGLVSHGDRLYVTGIELRLVQPDDRTRLLDTTYYGLVPLTGVPGGFVHGNHDGVALDRAEGGTWKRFAQHAKISGSTTVLCEQPAGVVWAANHVTGLWRIDFRGGLQADAPARNFTSADGLPSRLNQYNIEVFPLGSGVGAVAINQLLRFDETAARFVPETRVEGLPRGADGITTVLRVSPPAADGSWWLQLREPSRLLVRVVPIGPNRWRAETPPGTALTRLRATALLPDAATQTLWIGAPGGLLSRDLTLQPTYASAPLVAVIRRVERADGQLVWADGNRFMGRTAAPPPADAATARATLPAALPANHNALRVLFAAPGYSADHLGRPHLRFRTKLEGLDADWTAWSVEAKRDFTNLPYRDFVLHVQAQDDDGRTSPAALLGFTIAPPWWRTPWAYGAWSLLGLATIGGLIGWRTRALHRRAARLEAMVAARTEELRRSNAELARLHRLERDEKLAARLAEEKARLEVLRYQLNPHFLFNALNSVCASINHAPSAARAMVVRLAEFCRQTLHRPGAQGDEAAMTIGQELAMLRSYLDIEKMRLGELLSVQIENDPATEHVPIPPFLLLPLVENAVKYGTATSTDYVGIRLTVRAEPDEAIAIEIANTGEWLEPGAHSTPSTGIGIENLRQRLARYYPRAHEFTTSEEAGWVTVRVRLLQPMREAVPVTA